MGHFSSHDLDLHVRFVPFILEEIDVAQIGNAGMNPVPGRKHRHNLRINDLLALTISPFLFAFPIYTISKN
jgi:hypothetical protein